MYVSIGKARRMQTTLCPYAFCCEVSIFGRGECEYREDLGGGLVVLHGMTASWKRAAHIVIQAFRMVAVKKEVRGRHGDGDGWEW